MRWSFRGAAKGREPEIHKPGGWLIAGQQPTRERRCREGLTPAQGAAAGYGEFLARLYLFEPGALSRTRQIRKFCGFEPAGVEPLQGAKVVSQVRDEWPPSGRAPGVSRLLLDVNFRGSMSAKLTILDTLPD
jgi:hypothetical protein